MERYEQEHLERLRAHLAECTVLLKTNGAFPLAAPGKIAAFGNGVRRTVKGGTGSGEVNSRFFVNVEQGLRNAGFTVTTSAWLDGYEAVYAEAKKAFIKQLKAEAKAAKTNAIMYGMGKAMPEPNYDLPLDGEGEAAIYVLSRISGEGNDRQGVAGDIKLSATEKRDILALNKKYDKFMLVINAGGPVDLSEVQEVGNILVLSQLGVQTGDALADILLGKESPSGKLTTTWSAWEDYATIGDFGDPNDTHYREGVYVGYRYFDSVGKQALYPFGFGCSYTTFETKVASVTLEHSRATVKATVSNTGAFSGKEVVQVYISTPAVKLDKPYQDLAGFVKTSEIAPGAEETVEISFDLKDLASFDESRAAYILEPGLYIVRLGNSSIHTTPVAVIELAEEVVTLQARNCLGNPGFADWKPENPAVHDLPGDVIRLTLDAAAVASEAVAYQHEYEIDEAVKALTDEQLAYVNVGAFDPKGGIASFVGNASTTVVGAAGETTSMLKQQGFDPIVMADGPAGIRIISQYYRDKKGAHGVGSSGMPESIMEMLPGFVQWIMKCSSSGKVPKGAVVHEQYCTAIPIGTAIAQSWNVDFAKTCGDIVGAEMERFGIHLWLAPALNIHRSILCGRNFEYFSEDPLISGKFAAALTQGVHFCSAPSEM